MRNGGKKTVAKWREEKGVAMETMAEGGSRMHDAKMQGGDGGEQLERAMRDRRID